LKHRHGIGYETLVKEISDSIKWRTFCKLKLTDPVPDSTTLIKATKRYGEKIINEINELLVEKAREKKVIRGRKLRVDSTTVEADIHYPTDASLLADGIKAVSKTIKKLKNPVKKRPRISGIVPVVLKREHLKPATPRVKKTRSTKSLLSL